MTAADAPIPADLLAAARMGDLDADQRQTLNALLRESAEAVRYYAEHMQICAELSWGFRVRSHAAADGSAARAIVAPRPRRLMHYAAMAIAAVIAAAVGLVFYLSDGDTTTAPAAKPWVALLADATDAIFDEQTDPLLTGAELRPGRIGIASGSIQLVFRSGASAEFVGPGVIDLTGPNGLRLVDGRLTALVPESARGFEVEAPNETRIVDLGTAFHIDARSGQPVEVHVIDGTVEVESPAGKQRLTRAQAVAVAPDGAITGIRFVDPSDAAPTEGLIAWWPLDEIDADGTVRNAVTDARDAEIGPGVGAVVTTPGVNDGALRFDGERGYVRVANPRSLWPNDRPFTVAMWLRTDTATEERWLMYREDTDDNPKVSVSVAAGRVWFKLRDHLGNHRELEGRDVAIDDGGWHLVVASRSGERMSLSVDGERVGEIDDAGFAGHFDPDAPSAWHLGSNVTGERFGIDGFFRGDIDDVRLYDRVLDPQEIRRMYRQVHRTARPNDPESTP